MMAIVGYRGWRFEVRGSWVTGSLSPLAQTEGDAERDRPGRVKLSMI